VHTQRARRGAGGSALGRVAVEVGELLAIAALREQRRRVVVALLEAVEALVRVAEPVAALRVLALVEEVDAQLALAAHDPVDGRAEVVRGAVVGQREAAGVRGEEPVGAAAHGRIIARRTRQ
jgi:hypothetical protein